MKKRNILERVLSWVLTLAMVLSLVPAISMQSIAAVDDFIVERIADDSTMDQWKVYFGPDHLDTEFAGAVWTDKSVFKDAGAFSNAVSLRNERVTMLNPDNFLVALSAIASNKEIVGYSTVPTDTMLVLDLSGSMMPDTNVPGYNNISTKDISNIEAMVDAANDAINQLEILARRGYFSIPQYKFTEKHDNDGNPIWICNCHITEQPKQFSARSSSKKEAKKSAAYKMLRFVLEI
jgi:hypothetical protein